MALSSASSISNSRGRPVLRGPGEGVTDLLMGGIIERDHFLIKYENNDLRSACGCREGVAPALQGNQERGKMRNSDCMGLTNASTATGWRVNVVTACTFPPTYPCSTTGRSWSMTPKPALSKTTANDFLPYHRTTI